VREAWPSPATGTTHTQGLLAPDCPLVVTVETDRLVVFGDGLERDRLILAWGEDIHVGVDQRTLRLVS
jgi:hypothetical protein